MPQAVSPLSTTSYRSVPVELSLTCLSTTWNAVLVSTRRRIDCSWATPDVARHVKHLAREVVLDAKVIKHHTPPFPLPLLMVRLVFDLWMSAVHCNASSNAAYLRPKRLEGIEDRSDVLRGCAEEERIGAASACCMLDRCRPRDSGNDIWHERVEVHLGIMDSTGTVSPCATLLFGGFRLLETSTCAHAKASATADDPVEEDS
ncbi:hypothetical protein GGR52DRAFT_330928 [Hypoxylon sp. FL1284]|nr:hypothetical protein GGR52DRAFT_330928 [Hypoxylon sp. FL1284]